MSQPPHLPADPPIQLSSQAIRPTQQEQIAQFLEHTRTLKDQLRIRIPITVHMPKTRNYVPLREATWNLHLNPEETTVQQVEQLVVAVGVAIQAITTYGSGRVMEHLRTITGEVTPETIADAVIEDQR